jgi:hypothetical protein
MIDFEAFRHVLVAALTCGMGPRAAVRPTMHKVLVLAAQNDVADARMEFLIRDRLSWLRFRGFDLGAPTPDVKHDPAISRMLTDAGVLDAVFTGNDRQLKERGFLATGGQIVDATPVAAPKQRNTAP